MHAYGHRLRVLLFFYPTQTAMVLLFIMAFAGVIIGWYAMAIMVCGIAAAFLLLWRGRSAGDRTAELRQQWGKTNDRDRDFEALEDQYLTLHGNTPGSNSLDASTWADLNMDSVYGCLDRTYTNAGELMLYTMLHNVLIDHESLLSRNRAISCFLNNEALREKVVGILDRLGRDDQVDLAELLWTDNMPDLGHMRLYNILALSAVASVLSAIFLSSDALFYFVLPLFFINSLLSFVVTRDQVLASFRTLRYLGKMIDAAEALTSTDHSFLSGWTNEIIRKLRGVSSISRGIRRLNPEGAFALDLVPQLLYFVSTFLLLEVRTFNRVMREVRLHRTDLQDMVRLTGELDALQSMASFRGSLLYCCEPEFLRGSASMNIQEGWHPLTSAPVANSLHCESASIFVTGSNMAGKSTFLRMIAVNAILAQTFHVCCARAYSATPFRIASSINHVDDITESASYFLTEGRRLLHLLQAAETDHTPFLCIIDEVLRGTNSAERHAASLAILRYMAGRGATVIVASHDTDLGYLLKDRYRLFHFSESFEQDKLLFDYRLKTGICDSGNAIRTLGWLGFPSTVVEEAKAYLDQIRQNNAFHNTSSINA